MILSSSIVLSQAIQTWGERSLLICFLTRLSFYVYFLGNWVVQVNLHRFITHRGFTRVLIWITNLAAI